MWKFSTFSEFAFYVLLLLAFPPAVISNEIPKPRQCAVCLEKDCATGVSEIYPADSDTAVWVKANSPTGIQTCSMENLKPDAPCKMANGNLVQLANEMLRFEGVYPRGKRRIFHSQISPCADLINSKPSPGMCVVCLEPRCATIVTIIWLKGNGDSILWKKQDEEIPQCFNDNLKSDKPCQVPNGNLVLRTANELEFEWKNLASSDVGSITSVNMPCADLNLPSSSTLSPDNKGGGSGIVSGSINVSFIVIAIAIVIGVGVLIGKRKSRGQGQDKDHRHGNNKVPPHDAEDCDENTMGKQPLKGGVPNGTVNGVHREDDSVGPEGYLDDSPV